MSINYIDLLVLILMVLSTYIGYKKGFLKTITGVLSIVLSLILAVTFYPQMEKVIKSTPVYESVYKNVEERIAPPDVESNKISDYGAGTLNLPRNFLKKMQDTANNTKEDIAVSIAKSTADSAVKIVSMLAVFLLARLAIFLLVLIAGLIKKFPLIGWSDRLLGVLFGFVRGFFIVYLLLAIITVSAQFKSDNFAAKAVKQSEFAKIMYNNNVFLDFIYKY